MHLMSTSLRLEHWRQGGRWTESALIRMYSATLISLSLRACVVATLDRMQPHSEEAQLCT